MDQQDLAQRPPRVDRLGALGIEAGDRADYPSPLAEVVLFNWRSSINPDSV